MRTDCSSRLADEDVLYFRVDDSSRSYYVAEGAEPFAPMGPGTKSMNYFAVPARLYDDAEELSVWLARAINAARASAGKPRKRRT